ncbi:MAG TPA: peptide-methionine (R)-S-oxide reductase MsrB [Candidatus Saccharimonadales bacterium]|nr:peptide-methionine (R)-S-oxide reductase MsrB [Candidatus Saccharimonadales bacterium]
MDDLKNKPEEYWKKKLTPEQYKTLRESGTEHPFTGKFFDFFEDGMYHCAACGQPLFPSDTKFDSSCGWPSFDRSLEGNVVFKEDDSYGMHRIEVRCSKCDSHLGHVFDMDETKTGKWFCINSNALDFKPQK